MSKVYKRCALYPDRFKTKGKMRADTNKNEYIYIKITAMSL
jgi:hypothetical protein